MRRSDLYSRIISLVLLLLSISILLQLLQTPLQYAADLTAEIRSLSRVTSSPRDDSNFTTSGSSGLSHLSSPRNITAPPLSDVHSTNTHAPSPRFLVVILSAARNSDLRDMLRTEGWLNNTWTQSGGRAISVRHCFLVGYDEEVDLEGEAARYKDIAVWLGPDSYRNIVHKLSWFLGSLQHQHLQYSYDFLVKLDDDSYLDVTKLAQSVADISPDVPWYGGECISNKLVYRAGKFAVCAHHYSSALYPTYAAGAGYVLSAALVQRIVSVMWRVPQFAVEDAYFGVLINMTGTEVECLEGFYHEHWWKFSTDVLGTAVLLHKVKLEDIKLIQILINRFNTVSNVNKHPV